MITLKWIKLSIWFQSRPLHQFLASNETMEWPDMYIILEFSCICMCVCGYVTKTLTIFTDWCSCHYILCKFLPYWSCPIAQFLAMWWALFKCLTLSSFDPSSDLTNFDRWFPDPWPSTPWPLNSDPWPLIFYLSIYVCGCVWMSKNFCCFRLAEVLHVSYWLSLLPTSFF